MQLGDIKRPEGVPLVDGDPTHLDQIEADGTYTKNSINDLVDRKLREPAEGLKKFGNAEPAEEKGRKKSGGRKSGGKKKA